MKRSGNTVGLAPGNVVVVVVVVVTAVGGEELLLVSLLVTDVSDLNLLLRFDVRDGLYLQDDKRDDGQTEKERETETVAARE